MKQLEVVQNISDEVSYSVKTNVEVAKVLEGNCWFSVHSLQNLMLLEDKSKVWFFSQGWNAEFFKELLSLGVKSFVIDNENDLKVLLDNSSSDINLLLRMKLKEHTIHTGKHFVFGFNSNKINELIPELKEKVNKLGVHFHRKTQNVSEWNLKEELIDSISEENLSKLDYVNIGGGIPAQYKNFRKEVIDYIFKKIEELKEFDIKVKIKRISLEEFSYSKKYSAIFAINTLEFMERKELKNTVNSMKSNTLKRGINVIKTITVNDPQYKKRKDRIFLKLGELKKFYKDWEIIHYQEYMGEPERHTKDNKFHRHAVAEIIARKK